MTDKKIKIAGIVGSLRDKSYNKATILAAKELLSESIEMDVIFLSDIPMFNEDIESQGIPESVANLKKRLEDSDGVLIATPEYNFSMPAVLKNALDWASRGEVLPLYGKPLAIVSASMSMLGGARVQYQLRQVCTALNLLPINRPEVFISNAHTKFDDDGKLIDEATKDILKELLDALIDSVKNNK